MTFADFRAWVALAGGVLLFGLFFAMLLSGLRESARRRRAGWAGHLSGGAPRPERRQVPATLLYANAHRDNPPGEEGPPVYQACGRSALVAPPRSTTDEVLVRAVEQWVQWFERMAQNCGKARLEGDLSALRSIIVRAQRAGRIAAVDAETLVDSAETRVWVAFAAPKAKVASRQDGIRLSDDATAALLRKVFGQDPPIAGRSQSA